MFDEPSSKHHSRTELATEILNIVSYQSSNPDRFHIIMQIYPSNQQQAKNKSMFFSKVQRATLELVVMFKTTTRKAYQTSKQQNLPPPAYRSSHSTVVELQLSSSARAGPMHCQHPPGQMRGSSETRVIQTTNRFMY